MEYTWVAGHELESGHYDVNDHVGKKLEQFTWTTTRRVRNYSFFQKLETEGI